MPTYSEATRLNLEYYKKQAKALLHRAREGDAAASAQMEGKIALHAAQRAIAREQGFASWPRFRAFLEQSDLDFQGLAAEFVKTALHDRRRAEEMLSANPKLAGAGLYLALVLGDRDQVERAIVKLGAAAKGGPHNWPPIVYCCFSRFANPASGRAEGLVETARMLLAHGADPNTSFLSDEYPGNPFPVLYGATGMNNNPAMGRVLLEAGANPDDSESLYHSTEHGGDFACVKLLLEFGAPATQALNHMLDAENLAGLKLLLDAGADTNKLNHRGETALHWAVWRGRSPQSIAAILDHGSAIDARRGDGLTAYALAELSGQTEVAALLASRGADTNVPPLERSPEIDRLLPDMVSVHGVAAVHKLLAAGVPIDTRGEHGATPLHWACWKGYPDLVKLFLSLGAPLDVKDTSFNADPPGWFDHGRQNNGDREHSDYAAVAELLRAAGCEIAD
jgi:ankyrin repeat protein